MNNSKYFSEIEGAREFEQDAKQLFNYATCPDTIDAAIYFIKGAEIMQKVLASRAINEHKQEDIKVIHYKTLLERLKGGKRNDYKKAK